MKRSAVVVGSVAAWGLAAALTLRAQAPISDMSLLIGEWKVDATDSTYFPGPKPDDLAPAQLRRYVDQGAGFVGEVRIGVTIDGGVVFSGINVWSGKFDGVDYPAFNLDALFTFLERGIKPIVTRSYKVVDRYTLEQTAKTGTAVRAIITTAVSRDGKTFKETVKTDDASGRQNAQNVIVYVRQ